MLKQMSHSDPDRYTDPELRDRIKAEVVAGDKGGKPGQWSARKAQLVASEYEREGGGYKQAPDKQQESLIEWGEEKWRTADGKKAEREGGTTRYLPDEAWKSLSKSEQASTNKKKREGSKEGKQFVANTKPAAEARKRATAKAAAKKRSKEAPAKKKPAPAKKAAEKEHATPKKAAH
jgi:hypothetical protein